MSLPLRLLLVEDSEDDALLLLRMLRKGGYEPEARQVKTQSDMRAALEEAEWDLIISDYSMPGFDGLAALKLYREADLDIPFLLVSGTIGEETAVEAMRAGAHDYLMKDRLTRLLPAIGRELHEAEIRRAHRQAQEALQANEKKYRLLVEHAPSGIYEFDLSTGRFLSVNEVMCEYTCYTREEFLSLTPLDLLTGESQQRFRAQLTQMKQADYISETVEYEICGKGERKFWVILRARVTQDEAGLRALVVVHDITERKLAEEKLHRYAERLSTFHEIDQAILTARSEREIAQATINHVRRLVPCMAAGAVIFEEDTYEAVLLVVDTAGKIQVPPGTRFALSQYLGIEELLSVLYRGEVLLLEDMRDLAQRWPLLNVLVESGMRLALIVPLLFQNTLLGFVALISSNPAEFGAEQIEVAREVANQLAIAIRQTKLVDQIRRHAVELEDRVEDRTRQLRLANEHLKTLSRVKDEFVSNVSHELRTPITNMLLYHRLISLSPDKLEKYLDILGREIHRLSNLIEDLLYLSRLDQDRIELKLAPTDLKTLISQFVEDRQLLARERGLALSFAAEASTPVILADEGLVGQVFSILLTNAMNYTPAGGRIDVRITRHGNEWGISVSDTGPGINPDEQEKIFERFFRGAAGRDSVVAGTGLGLSIAQEIIQRHGGRIEVYSSGIAGEGATFTIWLPESVGIQ